MDSEMADNSNMKSMAVTSGAAMTGPRPASNLSGHFAAAAAFCTWGLSPLYWKPLHDVPPLEIICHRIVWSVLFTAILLTAFRRWNEVRRVFAARRVWGLLVLTSTLVALNWLTYLYSVSAGYILESSMGYYITPLVNTLLGFVFLRERLRPVQLLAIMLAAAGVLNLVIGYGRFPWISLVLAFSFGIYGLVRKVAAVEPLPGLFCETGMLAPLAGGYLIHLHLAGQGGFGGAVMTTNVLLAVSGAFTALPLMLFAFGARRMRMVTLGFYQYITPTSFFFLAAFRYGEPFTRAHLITFLCIWAGICLYTIEGALISRRDRRNRRA